MDHRWCRLTTRMVALTEMTQDGECQEGARGAGEVDERPLSLPGLSGGRDAPQEMDGRQTSSQEKSPKPLWQECPPLRGFRQPCWMSCSAGWGWTQCLWGFHDPAEGQTENQRLMAHSLHRCGCHRLSGFLPQNPNRDLLLPGSICMRHEVISRRAESAASSLHGRKRRAGKPAATSGGGVIVIVDRNPSVVGCQACRPAGRPAAISRAKNEFTAQRALQSMKSIFGRPT